MSNRPLAIGVVGAGKISQVAYLSSFAQTPGCQIVALADPRPELAKQVAHHFDIPRVYANHDQLLQDPSIDAVVVVMPPEATGPVAMSCLTAGKHLLTADPMGCSVEQARVLVEAAQESGVVHAVGCLRTHDAGIEYGRECVRQFVDSGELGAITNIRVMCYQGNSDCDMGGIIETTEVWDLSAPQCNWDCAPDWIADKHLNDYADSMASFFDSIDLFRWFSSCQPTVQFASLDGAGTGLVALDCGNHSGFLEFGNCSWDRWDQCVEVTFQNGRVRVIPGPAFLPNQPARVEIETGGPDGAMLIPHIENSWSFHRMAASFVAAAARGEPLDNSAINAMADLQLLEDVWRSAIEGAAPVTRAPARTRSSRPTPAPQPKPWQQQEAPANEAQAEETQPSTEIQPAVDIMDALRRKSRESAE